MGLGIGLGIGLGFGLVSGLVSGSALEKASAKVAALDWTWASVSCPDSELGHWSVAGWRQESAMVHQATV
jgi:hypothetical protein